MKDFFGKTDEGASISFELNGATRAWNMKNGKWQQESSGTMSIKGFYEGSIIFGNRFKNTNYNLLKKFDKIDDSNLEIAEEFLREHLGVILHNNKDFYEKLLILNGDNVTSNDAAQGIEFKGDIFYYQKYGKRVSQFHMSTGENLLISILNSLNIRNKERGVLSKPCLIFLDEIELALHPSSLIRLMSFLKSMSTAYNYAIYFSTHSIELISSISPDNIFFLERHADESLETINPCYPAYATRILYDRHTGYDYVLLVEDDLAKGLIWRLLHKYALLSSKLVHVLPCGGFSNVIELAQEVVDSNLIGKVSGICIILDGDIREQAQQFIKNKGIINNIPLNYLPIPSLEKYLKTKLFDSVDHKLFRILNDSLFHRIGLNEIIGNYKNNGLSANDSNGKKLFERIDSELRERGLNRVELNEIIIEYLIDNNTTEIQKIVQFLKIK